MHFLIAFIVAVTIVHCIGNQTFIFIITISTHIFLYMGFHNLFCRRYFKTDNVIIKTDKIVKCAISLQLHPG